MVRLKEMTVETGLMETVLFVAVVELANPERLETGTMVVVLSFETVTRELAEVMLGGGLTWKLDVGTVIVATGVPLLTMVGGLSMLSTSLAVSYLLMPGVPSGALMLEGGGTQGTVVE